MFLPVISIVLAALVLLLIYMGSGDNPRKGVTQENLNQCPYCGGLGLSRVVHTTATCPHCGKDFLTSLN